MSVVLDEDLVLNDLLENLREELYFIIISSENGVITKSYINENEFNKSAISLYISQLYETAEEITESIGIQQPDFNIVHSDNFYVLSIKILNRIIVILMKDQVEISEIFSIVNNCIKPK